MFKRYKKILILIIIFFPFHIVFSQEGESIGPEISFAPHTVEVSVLPGEKKQGIIKIKNTGGISLPFRLDLINFTAEEETGNMIIDKRMKGGLKDWIKFNKKDYFIDAGKVEKIKYEMEVPAEAAPGGYYALAIFNSAISQFSFNETETKIHPGLGILFLISVEGAERVFDPAKVEKFEIIEEKRPALFNKIAGLATKKNSRSLLPFQVVKSSDPEFEIKIKNIDPYHIKLSGSIELDNYGSEEAGIIKILPVTILPGKSRVLRVAGEKRESEELISDKDKKEESNYRKTQLKSPVVAANLNLKIDADKEKKERSWLFLLSWQFYLLLALILFLSFIYWKKRRRKKIEKG